MPLSLLELFVNFPRCRGIKKNFHMDSFVDKKGMWETLFHILFSLFYILRIPAKGDPYMGVSLFAYIEQVSDLSTTTIGYPQYFKGYPQYCSTISQPQPQIWLP